MPTQIVDAINKWKNAFSDIFILLRGEILDTKGMVDAMNGREMQQKIHTKMMEKKREKQEELDKMTLGKTTLKSFFKSKNTIEKDILNYQHSIDQLNIDLEEQGKLINFITIYHGQKVIDTFKQLKIRQYFRLLNTISVKEITNSHITATLAHKILEIND